MKFFICIVLLAAAASAAPAAESKRDKRGYLSSDWSHDPWAPSYSFDSHYELPSFHEIHHAPIISVPKAKIISINKVVEVPKVVEVKKVISVPKVVSVPQIVKVHKVVHEPTYEYAHSSGHGWW